MRQIINKNDLKNIIGKFVVQLSNSQEDVDFTTQNHDGFWLEKRISFVGQLDLIGNKKFLKEEYSQKGMSEGLIVLNGFYYCHGIYTRDEFVDYFNTGSPVYDEKEFKDKRFLRLLTSKELEWLNKQQLKKNIY